MLRFAQHDRTLFNFSHWLVSAGHKQNRRADPPFAKGAEDGAALGAPRAGNGYGRTKHGMDA